MALYQDRAGFVVSASHTASIVNLLNAARERLRTQNRTISLRSLSAQVKLSPSYLSKILSGQRGLPLKQIAHFERALQLDPHEVAQLRRLVLLSIEERELQHAPFHAEVPAETARLVQDYGLLGTKDLWMLEEWFHLPILNLVTTTDFEATAENIAVRLTISAQQASDSLQRLIAAGHLMVTGEGRVERSQSKVRFPTQRSHPAILRFHRAMIQKALAKTTQLPSQKEFAERLISGVTFAADPSKVPEIKTILEDAIYKVAEILSETDCKEVFQINLQLFSLSN
jgi:uncharacterized protein (TIGR02147 family)